MNERASSNPERIDLAVIVLNYRTPGMVVDCLASLDGQISAPNQRVVVVDNCSGDDSADRIEAAISEHGWGAWAEVVRSATNGGFAAGNNVGIRHVDAACYLLLNSDTIVREGAVETMMQTLEEHPGVSLLGPRLEWPDGQPQISTFRYRTPISELLYGSGLGLLFRIFPKHEVARELHEWTAGIDWVSFACVAIRREVVESIGLLDEGYFMYFEDMDFCRRATGAGFEIAYQPGARVVHLQGESSGIVSGDKAHPRRPRYYYEARSWYLQKYYGIIGRLVSNLLWTIGWVMLVARGKSASACRECFDIWISRSGRSS